MYRYVYQNSKAWENCARLVILFCLLTITPEGLSAEYLPEFDDEVIAMLSPTVVAIAANVRRSESQTPQNSQPSSLLREIVGAYTLARQTNDARAYGYTLSLLEMWPGSIEAPPLVLIIEAATLQHSHEFDRALKKLDSVLQIAPNNLQAHLIALQIHLVRGEYPEVKKTCSSLVELRAPVLAINCQGQLLGLTGMGTEAIEMLLTGLEYRQLDAAQALELHTTIATIAHRLELHEIAACHYSAALKLAPENSYLLVHFSDWLLEQGRYDDVIEFLRPTSQITENFELKLRLYAALLTVGDSESTNSLLQEIHAEAQSMKARGEDRPHKLLALYELQITGDSSASLTQALANWQQQKDPGDALLLARAAKASGDQRPLIDVRTWQRLHGLEDYRLDAVLAGADSL